MTSRSPPPAHDLQQNLHHDYLGRLPPELLHIIISFLLPTHVPDRVFLLPQGITPQSELHPIVMLASASKDLRRECSAWCHHFLRQHTPITKYKPSLQNKRGTVRNYILGRYGLITWMTKHCIFCGKKSVRSAVLVSGFMCCASCDLLHWPDKITKTEARKEYDLKDHHLFPSRSDADSSSLPRVRYGTYFSASTPTTLFLRAEIEALANAVHGGDFAAHKIERERALQKRRDKIESNKRIQLEKKQRDAIVID